MALFRLGTIAITPAASGALEALGAEPGTYLAGHQEGDWGQVDETAQQDNDFALQHNQVICSTYKLSDGTELLVITLGDRSSTRVFLAAEYPVRKVSTQEGYALWAATYDSAKNPLIAIEEPYVEAMVATFLTWCMPSRNSFVSYNPVATS
jgi:hypothetical protein